LKLKIYEPVCTIFNEDYPKIYKKERIRIVDVACKIVSFSYTSIDFHNVYICDKISVLYLKVCDQYIKYIYIWQKKILKTCGIVCFFILFIFLQQILKQ